MFNMLIVTGLTAARSEISRPNF